MPQPQCSRAHDLAFVERRREPRIILSVPAHYTLANRCDNNGKRREFACRIVNISLRAMTLFAPVNGAIGERVVTHSDEFGRLEGKITRILNGGFVIALVASDEERERLAARIEGYEKIKNYDFVDRRQHKRIIPKDPRSVLVFGDNNRLECFIIDVSTSGAAVSAGITPEIGTPLAVGALVGRVVRHFRSGFAVQFVQLQNIDGLEQSLVQGCG
jgi:hypothetical protein